MRLSGFSLVGLLVTLALVALLMVQLLGAAKSVNSGNSGAGTSTGMLGGYANAISSAQQSAAQQNAAASQASQTAAP